MYTIHLPSPPEAQPTTGTTQSWPLLYVLRISYGPPSRHSYRMAQPRTSRPIEPGAHVSRIATSIGALDLIHFVQFDHAFPRHSHEEYTVGVFGTGNGTIGYRGSAWRAFDASILAVTPDEVHTADPLAGSGWTYRAMYPSAALMAIALGDERARDVPAFFAEPIVNDPLLARAIQRAHRHLSIRTVTIDEETELLGVLRRLARRHADARPEARATPHAVRSVLVAREYLHAHFQESIKLAPLARLCHVDPYELVRRFGAVVGMPPHAYLTQVRANRARELLGRGEPTSHVAYACGFCDQAHLTRTFKRIFGITPGVYVASQARRTNR